jgi:hypothetical protein
MEPPWVKHSDISAGSIGWRMGRGEDYLDQFSKWFGSLSHAEQEAYARANPLPRAWRGKGIFRKPPWPQRNVLEKLLALSVGKLMAAALVLIAIVVLLLAII